MVDGGRCEPNLFASLDRTIVEPKGGVVLPITQGVFCLPETSGTPKGMTHPVLTRRQIRELQWWAGDTQRGGEGRCPARLAVGSGCGLYRDDRDAAVIKNGIGYAARTLPPMCRDEISPCLVSGTVISLVRFRLDDEMQAADQASP